MSFLLTKFAVESLRGRDFSVGAHRHVLYQYDHRLARYSEERVVADQEAAVVTGGDREALDRFMGTKPASDEYSGPPVGMRAVR